MITADFEKTFDGWRKAARQFLQDGISPSEINWDDQTPDLFSSAMEVKKLKRIKNTVPNEFIDLAQSVACSYHEDRWALLYRILYRLQYENPDLLNISIDSDINRAQLIKKSVKRDIHKMHAFVRFKKVTLKLAHNSVQTLANSTDTAESPDAASDADAASEASTAGDANTTAQEVYVAWHKPEHFIVRAATPFFARRFGDRPWSIFTPHESAHWDLKSLTFGPGLAQSQFDVRDDWDEIWKTYYKSIFNPARIKIKAMKTEMATKYWSTLPEASLIQDMIRDAPRRLQEMAKTQQQSARVDLHLPLTELREQAKTCQSCPLYSQATQTVFGQGPQTASLMIVGEAPGDQEDVAGVPFIGPAGKLLNEELAIAGLVRDEIYLTNAVKHFKWTRQDKMRLHKKPSGPEMTACKPWLEAEIFQVRPQIILALGATAGTAILGRLPKITEERGKVFNNVNLAPNVVLSWHPSAILRGGSDEEKTQRRLQLRADLELVAKILQDQNLSVDLRR